MGICKFFRKGNPQNLETEKCEVKRSKLWTSVLGLGDGQRMVMVIGTRSIKSTEGKLVEWEVPAGQPGDGRGPREALLLVLPIHMEHAHVF